MHGKSKLLMRNRLTQANPHAAFGIPTAPALGVACQPPPHAKHGPVLTFTVSTPHPAATGPASAFTRPHRIAFATLPGSESVV